MHSSISEHIDGPLIRRGHPVPTAVAVVLCSYVTVSVVFAVLGTVVSHHMNWLTRWDDSVVRWFSVHRTGWVDTFTDLATKVGDTLGVVIVLVVAVVVLLTLNRRSGAVLLVVAVALELVTFLTVNAVVDRPRPETSRLGSLPSTSSFPSGHTAVMVALYGGLAFLVSERCRFRAIRVGSWIVALLITAIVGFARVYRGMHQPTDAVAGALLGLAVLIAAALTMRAAQRALEPPPIEDVVVNSAMVPASVG